ncbi:MAG TPA: hypothetical protein DD670_05690, partial [Planctomycetaceae bacterium]|nr:hypothetical protein [Planctomycetaceae bacterium]
MGYASGSTGQVNVSGAGSTWTNTGALYVGRAGGGSVTISNGGKVSSSVGRVGELAGSTGSVIVSGIGSTWTAIDLFVGC